MGRRVTYDEGGLDTAKPNNNIVSVDDTPDDPVQANEGKLHERLRKGRADNGVYLDAPAKPTNAERIAELEAQVRKLTRLANALIRLQLSELDATD